MCRYNITNKFPINKGGIGPRATKEFILRHGFI